MVKMDGLGQIMMAASGEYLMKGTDTAQVFVARSEVAGGNAAINSYQKLGGIVAIGCTNIGKEEAKILLHIFNCGNYYVRDMGTEGECLYRNWSQ